MKKIYYVFSLLSILILTISCDSYLDIKPKGIVIPEKCSDYEQLLNYAQLMKSSDSYPNYITDDVLLPYQDDLTGGYKFADLSIQNLYSFAKEVYGDGEADGLWEYSYNRIYTYNVIISNVMNSTNATEEHKKQIRAEALMGRAFEYLTLVNAYANHYDKDKASTDPGVPLMLDENINKTNLQRASVQQVYDQIKLDLDEASQNLPDKPILNSFRASKPVGYGMLARMYLYMGNYNKALENAKESLKHNSSLLNLCEYKVVDPEKAIGRLDVPARADNPENIYIRLAPYVFGLSSRVYGSSDLISLFDKDKDMRYKLFFTRYLWGYVCKNDLWAPYIYANMAMSTPEIYLIAAECEARVGTITNAMDYLNKLRDKRILNNIHLSVNTKALALKYVLEERRRELAMNGCMRLIDLKRLNRETAFSKTIIHEIDGKEYTLEPNSPRYILPIPPNILRFNPNMTPNNR